METITKTADHVAGQDDRYFMVVMFLMLVVVSVWGVRFLVNKLEKCAQDGIDAREKAVEQTERLLVLLDHNTRSRDNMIAAMDRNTNVISDSNVMLASTRAQLKEANAVIAKYTR